MSAKSVNDMVQENVSKPRFCKSLSLGETWSSKSMVRMIPEEFVRSTPGAFEHRVVLSVRWGNSWQLWLQRDKNGLLFMEEEDWDEFVNDNFLGPNDVLLFTHQNTMFIEVRIYKQDSYHLKEITSAPLEAHPQAQVVTPKPQNSPLVATPASAPAPASASGARQADALVKNPEQYLLNPNNPFFVKTLGKKNDVLYVTHLATEKYGLQFGPHNSPMLYLLPNDEKIEAATKIYGGCPCFSGWAAICRKYKLKQGDTVVCELERSGGLVTAVRVHFHNE